MLKCTDSSFTEILKQNPAITWAFMIMFMMLITKGAEQAVRPEEARNVIRIIELAFESQQGGKIVPFI